MSQHDFDIANQSASSARSDINSALKALASLSSGSTPPSTTYANMLWYETDTNTLKMRSEADDAWISIGYLNQSSDTFSLFDDTKVVNSGGTQTGVIGDQSSSVWRSGTGTTESLVSPAKVKAAIEELAPSLGADQVWQSLTGSRAFNTSYQNTTGKPIEVSVYAGTSATTTPPTSQTLRLQVSTNGSSWVNVLYGFLERTGNTSSYADILCGSITVPKGHYYRLYTAKSGQSLYSWSELR